MSDQSDPSGNGEAEYPELGVADLVARVREELETLDARRRSAGKPALFALREMELELQFTAAERTDGKGGIDLKVISVGGSKGVESSAVQKINLRFALDPTADGERALGSRGSASGGEIELEDTEPL
ncbi:MAG TPA: trypco2 family protein [Solirubrobacterales bacterium]|nr:trypco2 family protein [Solirubrobacterales bacterium]